MIRTTASGSRIEHRVLPVFSDLDESQVAIHTHTMSGSDGPVVGLLSCIHGSEWLAHDIVTGVLGRLESMPLRGSVIGVPVANPYAFRFAQRYSTDLQQVGFDNLSQCFNRSETSVTSLTAQVLAEQVIASCEVLFDFHPGPWGSTWDVVAYPGTVPQEAKCRELSVAFGRPMVKTEDVVDTLGHSSLKVACDHGIPVIIPEVGGLGFSEADERRWISHNVNGVLRVMAHLGMIELPPDVADDRHAVAAQDVIDVDLGWDVRPRHGGLLIPAVGLDRLGTPVRAGEHLADVLGAATLQVVERLESPGDGILLSVPRRHPVHPHNFAYAIGVRR